MSQGASHSGFLTEIVKNIFYRPDYSLFFQYATGSTVFASRCGEGIVNETLAWYNQVEKSDSF